MEEPLITPELSARVAEATAALQKAFPELNLLVLAAPQGTKLSDLPKYLRHTADAIERRVLAKRN